MKKSNLIKLFSILLISVMVMMFSTSVFAVEENVYLSLDGSNTGNSSNTGNGTNNTNNPNSANRNNTNNTNNNRNNTNNGSIYNNTNLPKTGVESSIPVALLVVVLGVSSVYAYKKIKDYKNI